MRKKSMHKKQCGTKECKFTPSLQSLIACFSPKMAQFFVKFLTFSKVLVLVSIVLSSKI